VEDTPEINRLISNPLNQKFENLFVDYTDSF
jgi:hypothetical protein